jgi:GMP synthase PP-ATPase subunit
MCLDFPCKRFALTFWINSPGLAIRILGQVDAERVAIARAADDIFISEIRAAGVYDEVKGSIFPLYEPV